MNALGSLGSYISKGVYSVSGPFHPFGGAVDIIVVEQSDGSFKSSPWYVRFGKFQGVLKSKEKIVKICVNGVEANFCMHLNNKGQAYFLKEVENEEEANKGDQPRDDCASSFGRRPMKSSSYNCVSSMASPGSPDETTIPRTQSDQMLPRLNSLECAEIAAELLDVNWSTALPTGGSPKKDVDKVCNGKNDSRDNNLEEDVARCRKGDSFMEEECEAISKMGEDYKCSLETRKSIRPTYFRCNNINRNKMLAHGAKLKSSNVGLDTSEEELSVKSEVHFLFSMSNSL